MPSVTIDAGVLVLPSESSDTEATHQYIETLLDWGQLLNQSWIGIYMSECASQALSTNESYPQRDKLKRLFHTHGIVEYDFNTVALVVDRLLNLTPTLEAYCMINDVLADDVTITPDILSNCASDSLSSDLGRCVVLISIIREHCRQPYCDHSLILRNVICNAVYVTAQIHDIEHKRDDLNDLPRAPETFRGKILVCDNFHGLILGLDEANLLTNAIDDIGLETAIRVAVYKFRLNSGAKVDWSESIRVRFCNKFLRTTHQICQTQSSTFPKRILRAIVETIEGVNLPDAHALRTSKSGGAPKRMRDNDKAMRRDIDNSYRLHYWQCEDEFVELGKITIHEDFSIPES